MQHTKIRISRETRQALLLRKTSEAGQRADPGAGLSSKCMESLRMQFGGSHAAKRRRPLPLMARPVRRTCFERAPGSCEMAASLKRAIAPCPVMVSAPLVSIDCHSSGLRQQRTSFYVLLSRSASGNLCVRPIVRKVCDRCGPVAQRSPAFAHCDGDAE